MKTTTVRESNLACPCISHGRLIKETARFYVYEDRWHKEKRIGKRHAHIEPCRCCEDHPQTFYPDGYDN